MDFRIFSCAHLRSKVKYIIPQWLGHLAPVPIDRLPSWLRPGVAVEASLIHSDAEPERELGA